MKEYKRKSNASCIVCGKAVYRRPIQLEQAKGRAFCGQVCYGIFCRKEKPCIVCGKPILASLHKKTCSRACSNKNRAGMEYKGRRPNDNAEHYRALKSRLLAERGSHCERCRYNKVEILQVHHVDRDRENNSLGNLELICPNCHAEEHYLKGSWLKKAAKAMKGAA